MQDQGNAFLVRARKEPGQPFHLDPVVGSIPPALQRVPDHQDACQAFVGPDWKDHIRLRAGPVEADYYAFERGLGDRPFDSVRGGGGGRIGPLGPRPKLSERASPEDMRSKTVTNSADNSDWSAPAISAACLVS